jgi:glycosyltransferase involved in cell wall biosynthesis
MSVSMLSEQLINAHFATEVYTTTANGNTELPVMSGISQSVDGVSVTYFTRLTKDHTHFSPALLKKLWKEAPGFHVIHIHAWWNFVSIFACLIAVIRKVPVLLSPRGTLSPYSFQNRHIGPKWLIHQLIGKFFLNKCHVHVTSAREGEAVISLFKPQSITMLPNFVRLGIQEPKQEANSSPFFRLLYFSRIEEKKGVDVLIEALAGIKLPYHLTIAGDGKKDYIASLKAIAQNNEVNAHITWVGFIDGSKFDLLARHDLFVLPSYDENFGNAVIESLSVGTAVLISGEVGLAAYVTKNRLGWVCQSTRASVADKINSIAIDGKAELSRIRIEAPPIILADFKEENLVKRYINMYTQLMADD